MNSLFQDLSFGILFNKLLCLFIEKSGDAEGYFLFKYPENVILTTYPPVS